MRQGGDLRGVEKRKAEETCREEEAEQEDECGSSRNRAGVVRLRGAACDDSHAYSMTRQLDVVRGVVFRNCLDPWTRSAYPMPNAEKSISFRLPNRSTVNTPSGAHNVCQVKTDAAMIRAVVAGSPRSASKMVS